MKWDRTGEENNSGTEGEDSRRMKWDRTGEGNNSGTGGKRVENEMGLERERGTGEQYRHWREERMKWDRTGEENNSGTGGKRVENEMGLERERRTPVALEEESRE